MTITYSHKVILLGDSCVGKTTIFDKLLYDKHNDTYSATIGVDYGARLYVLNNSQRIKLKFWDTAGQERFKSIVSTYYNSCNIVIFVFDANRYETFNNVENWINEYLNNCRLPTTPPPTPPTQINNICLERPKKYYLNKPFIFN